MSGSSAGQLGSPASPQEDDEPDFVHSYVEDFTIERYGPRVRLLVHSDELKRTLRAAGLRCAELGDVASGVAPWRECRRAARALQIPAEAANRAEQLLANPRFIDSLSGKTTQRNNAP